MSELLEFIAICQDLLHYMMFDLQIVTLVIGCHVELLLFIYLFIYLSRYLLYLSFCYLFVKEVYLIVIIDLPRSG
jgi:hypothetical protein